MNNNLKIAGRRGRWAAALLYVGFIYLMIPYTRPVTNFLLQQFRPNYGAFINALLVTCLIEVLIISRPILKEKSWEAWAWTAYLVLGTLWLVFIAVIPDDRLHYIYYGILGVLFFRALELDLSLEGACVAAIALASVAGYFDEFIQKFTPGRVYDVNDVRDNAVGAVLGGLFYYFVYHDGAKVPADGKREST